MIINCVWLYLCYLLARTVFPFFKDDLPTDKANKERHQAQGDGPQDGPVDVEARNCKDRYDRDLFEQKLLIVAQNAPYNRVLLEPGHEEQPIEVNVCQ